MKLVNLYTVKQMILAERDKIRLTVPAATYELVKEKPNMHGNAMRGGIRIALRCLENAPAVDAKLVRHGVWLWDEVDEGWYCSECDCCALNNYRGLSTDSDYCPNCGADMRGV